MRDFDYRHRGLRGYAPHLPNQILIEHQIADHQNALAGERVDYAFG